FADQSLFRCLLATSLIVVSVVQSRAEEASPAGHSFDTTATAEHSGLPETAAERGYRLLRTKAYLPPDFDQQVFDNLWQVWPEPLRTQARKATPAVRRKIAFSRYGLMEVPGGGRGRGPALGYVDDGKGGWVM